MRKKSPSSYRPHRETRHEKLMREVIEATRGVPRPDGEPLTFEEALGRAACGCLLNPLRRTVTLTFPMPPEPERLERARQAAGKWRVKVRVDPGGAPPHFGGEGGAGVREPRRPIAPTGSGRADVQDDT